MSDSENANEVSLDSTDSMSRVLTRKAFKGAEIASWMVKAHPHPMRAIDLALGAMTSIPVGFFLAGLLFYEDEAEGNFIASQSAFPMLLLLFLWLVVARKKTIYSYILTEDGAHVEDWQDYASFTPYIFKGIAITFFVAVLTMIAMEPSFIWMLAGPGAMAFAASSKLMTVENPVRQRTKKWSRYDLVFIDRKRKMIVTSYQSNTMAGFEIHVEKRRIDEVVALLKTLMPNAEFREEEWKW
ncbi:hypothetical protein CFII64_16616 [Pseudomonas sp. CFII64]|uniref:hypothetical protein n=1 Tax=Pseudomonas sp. CFII64 TaxID=911242 RepID=UPI0003578972|nr:hypothetical protein [Pseudomonas sp. CFII64]EPJ81841.1 hypothetical protein CFII64_16616 [Pseudomonas sp. CFII64]